MTALRRHAHDRLAALPGVRPVRRPITDAAGGQFDLYFVRSGLKSAHPVLIIPGGPGVASVAPYRGFRRRAAVAGLDVLMVEHRGVGLSRFDDNGAELPPEALTVNQAVDDLAAVLDDAGVGKAIVYGTSYGSYLAAGFGVRHRDRVHAMVLDSPVLSAHATAICPSPATRTVVRPPSGIASATGSSATTSPSSFKSKSRTCAGVAPLAGAR